MENTFRALPPQPLVVHHALGPLDAVVLRVRVRAAQPQYRCWSRLCCLGLLRCR